MSVLENELREYFEALVARAEVRASERRTAAGRFGSGETTVRSRNDRIVVGPHWRRWVAALTAAAVVLVLVVAIGVLTRETHSTGAASTIQRLVDGKWRQLPPSPLGDLGRAQIFSTQRGILVWGEYASAGTPPGFHGAIYEPGERTWRRIAEPPVALTLYGEWTGQALVFPRASLAYDVRTNRWRAIEQAPFLPGSSALYTWTGQEQELVVVSSECDPLDTPECTGIAGSVAAAYSPSKDRWRTLSPPPQSANWAAIAPTRDGLVLWGLGAPPTHAGATVLFNFATGSWLPVAEAPPDTGQSARATVVRTGRTLAWLGWYTMQGNDGELRAARLQGASWRTLRSIPHRSICGAHAFAGPPGSAVVLCSSTEMLLLDAVHDRWLQLPRAPVGIQALTWTGEHLYALSHHGRLLTLR